MLFVRITVAILFWTLLQASGAAAQSHETDLYKKVKKYDLSSVINPDSISDGTETFKLRDPIGFIDTNYQRFQIHFTSFKKSKSNPYQYILKGKTKVKDNICNFTGTLTVVSANIDSSSTLPMDIGLPGYRDGYITSNILLYENKKEPHSGSISGTLTTEIFIDTNNHIGYNAFMLVADGYSNNQFHGKWTSYKTGQSKKCNWGDGRIPDSNEFDVGAGEFDPDEKYQQNGWQTYVLQYENSPRGHEAARIENIEWWK